MLAHLLGEHRELRESWTILTTGRKGHLNYLETKRWIGKLAAVYVRQANEVKEMTRRGYVHKSDLDKTLAMGKTGQDELLATIDE